MLNYSIGFTLLNGVCVEVDKQPDPRTTITTGIHKFILDCIYLMFK